MVSIRKGASLMAASALGAGLLLAAPTASNAAQYPPTKPVRCGAGIKGKQIRIRIRPNNDTGYKYVIQRRKGKNKWANYKKGKVRPVNNNETSVKVKPGWYRVKCIGGPDRLDGQTSRGQVK
jgi:hypothetical protein